MTPRRLQPDERRAHILKAALDHSATHGWANLTRESAALAAGVSPGLVSWYFLSTSGLRAEVMRAAIDQRVLRVVADGLACRDLAALAAPVELRAAAFEAAVAV
jgi:AcrR family transcriptional regulator